ncbi:class II fructose-bisphosphate aldolase family protein [Actinomyces bowdenii]|uniref:class II fructose-bisphosphate aldolase n=1 Tax=Actinomyces bowdenii TaxID=131109 RepID=UPI00214C1C7F|nr:class II fructose-bisphosphate aldolase [Actinomyces bowdenii]MCR2052332.1 class II fructose-bisphosphate aldolase family protein [Actinomyces bowdenii]
MALTDLSSLAQARRRSGVGLGAFNVILLEHAEALTAAAERAGQPIVLQISQNAVAYHGSLAPIAAGTLAAASAASVPVVVHLDHATDVDLIKEAVELGLTSVMYDGSRLDDEANRRTTTEVVEHCHGAGVSVEAELGEVGGKDGVHAPGVRTDPEQAARFVADTGVDLLAVAVGSSHAMTERRATLDNGLITALARAVPVPLVLHGSSGVSDEGLRAAISAGMTKINVSTHLNVQFTARVRRLLEDNPSMVDPRKYVGPGMKDVGVEVESLLRWYAMED